MEITRDARGNPLEETQYAGDCVPFSPCSSGTCSIEEEPSLTEEQKVEVAAEIARLFPPNTDISKDIYRYDEDGRLVESKITMRGMIVNHQTFKYDEAGNKSEETNYDESGAIRNRGIITREYDLLGNWTKEAVSTIAGSDGESGLFTPCYVTRRSITYYQDEEPC